MASDFQITQDAGFVRATYRGNLEYETTTQMLQTVGRIAAEKHVRRVLFDIRAANYRDYQLGIIRHSEEAPGFGIDHSFRIAILGADDNPMLRYIEAVVVNRGFWAKVFVDEIEAEAWLRSLA